MMILKFIVAPYFIGMALFMGYFIWSIGWSAMAREFHAQRFIHTASMTAIALFWPYVFYMWLRHRFGSKPDA